MVLLPISSKRYPTSAAAEESSCVGGASIALRRASATPIKAIRRAPAFAWPRRPPASARESQPKNTPLIGVPFRHRAAGLVHFKCSDFYVANRHGAQTMMQTTYHEKHSIRSLTIEHLRRLDQDSARFEQGGASRDADGA
jgi:hypothetical protein